MLYKFRIIKEVIFLKLRSSTLVRFLSYPFITYFRKKAWKTYQQTSHCAYIKTFKNKHVGKRCFVIGNGPSLSPKDLDLIKNEYSFGTNRIYHVFDKTDWRPTYYMAVDSNVIESQINEIEKVTLKEKFINYFEKNHFNEKLTEINNIHFIVIRGAFMLNRNVYIPPETLSEDVSDHFTPLISVTCFCIEFAAYMGFKEIYLLGVDHCYPVQVHKNGGIVRNSTMKTAYFEGMRGGEHLAVQYVDQASISYTLCRTYAESHGIKIYNATRDSKLDIFNRVQLEDILER
jgi:hypothetical protein